MIFNVNDFLEGVFIKNSIYAMKKQYSHRTYRMLMKNMCVFTENIELFDEQSNVSLKTIQRNIFSMNNYVSIEEINETYA